MINRKINNIIREELIDDLYNDALKTEYSPYIEEKLGEKVWRIFLNCRKTGLSKVDMQKIMQTSLRRVRIACKECYQYKKYSILINNYRNINDFDANTRKVMKRFVKKHGLKKLNKFIVCRISMNKKELAIIFDWSYKKTRYWYNKIPCFHINTTTGEKSYFSGIKI